MAQATEAPNQSPLSQPHVGIVGGGQLARMLCLAAAPLGIRTHTVERKAECPAATLSNSHQVGDWNQAETLRTLAKSVDVLTLENEFVDADALATLEAEGVSILPSATCLRRIQDKFVQKETLRSAGLPTPRFEAVATLEELHQAAKTFGCPFVLKRRRNGYDGKGNYTVETPADIETGWRHLDGENHGLFAEAFCDFQAEIAVMICRSTTGAVVRYPVVETIQKNHICHVVKAPAVLEPRLHDEALAIAEAAVNAMEGIGSVGVELFLTRSGEIVVNELAPRVHNSGHYSIEACHTSQFENHLRAILGWPLGSAALRKPAAVMINLLGDQAGAGFPQGVPQALAIEGVHLHLYDKDQSQIGRKMGHLTVLGDSVDDALNRAQSALKPIQFAPNP